MNPPTCPFLGLRRDRGTLVAYPSKSNYCHKAVHLDRVETDHQSQYCLTENHTSCPYIQVENLERLPKEVRLKYNHKPLIALHWLRNVVIVLVVLTGIGAGWYVYTHQLLNSLLPQAYPPVSVTGTPLPSILLTPVPTQEEYKPGLFNADPGSTPQPLFPTVTPAPTESGQTPSLLPHGTSLQVYQIMNGDSVDLLANRGNTTKDAILAINYGLSIPLWVGRVIVIPVGMTDTSGLPQFEVRRIPEKTRVTIITRLNDCDIELFRQYNRSVIVTSSDIEYVLGGNWVLIPRKVSVKNP